MLPRSSSSSPVAARRPPPAALTVAVALSLLAPRAALWALPLAAAIAWSRIELGVHYTTDVVAGALLGTLIGLLVVTLVRRLGSTRQAAGRSPS